MMIGIDIFFTKMSEIFTIKEVFKRTSKNHYSCTRAIRMPKNIWSYFKKSNQKVPLYVINEGISREGLLIQRLVT